MLTVLHIGTGKGRRQAAHFLLGHLAGDLMWAPLALIALRWVQLLFPAVFPALTVAGALYLVYLGIRAPAAASALDSGSSVHARRPLAHGAVFGLINPKSHPVTLAIFTSVIAGNTGMLTAATVPVFLPAGALGRITADALLAWIVGLQAVRTLYSRAAPWITRGVAFLFFGFAASSLLHLG
ncbi:LysE family translocator [Streptomyces sp. NPDC048718]|uniref:LysE family translocator n=1 Tax=Streptomyces sp. NPDC048718 TaxID=3365587 RepID=UPI003713C4D8